MSAHVPRYRLQYQPRRLPGEQQPRVVPLMGNDKWATVFDNLSATQAIAKLMGTGALERRREQHVAHLRATHTLESSAVMDDQYFYRVVPVDPFFEAAPPIPKELLLERHA